ncbi:retrovirus-related pol polyprotein from transposon TNT 1-94, partial [Tanacetum coccineum]
MTRVQFQTLWITKRETDTSATIHDENVLLKTQVDSVVKERENVKLEYQKLFNSIKATRTQHKKELDELIEHVNQKTYAYADVRAQNQDLLITISELKNKLKTVDKGKNVNTKFDKSEASGTLLCVTPLPKNIAIKAKKVSNSKVNADRSKPVTSHPTLINEQGQTQNENVLARGMYRITKTETHTPDSKTNINVSNSTGVESSNSVRRQKSKDTKSKNRVLKNTNAKSSTAHVRKMSRSVSIDSNKCETMNSTLCHANKSVLNTKNVTAVNDGTDINLEGDDLLIGSRESNLYTISISEMSASSPVCLMSRATSIKSWLWHRSLSHLNFGTINQLTSKDLVDGLPKFKYNKDHLCLACEQGKSKKASLLPKLVSSTESKLELLHMDLCGPMRVASINAKKYILVIIDDYSQYTWVYFLRTKDEAPNRIIDFNCSIVRTRKMKLKADISIFIGYSKSSRGFHMYNRRTKKIIETIHVKFDELTAMASECDNSEPGLNFMNFQDSSKDSQSVPSKTYLDNLFGPLYEEYYETISSEV